MAMQYVFDLLLVFCTAMPRKPITKSFLHSSLSLVVFFAIFVCLLFICPFQIPKQGLSINLGFVFSHS